MTPTLRDREFVLVHINAKPEVGSLVLVAHPELPAPIIKRVREIRGSHDGEEVWLLSDNPAEGTDSRRFGSVQTRSVMGVVTLVLNRPFFRDPSFG